MANRIGRVSPPQAWRQNGIPGVDRSKVRVFACSSNNPATLGGLAMTAKYSMSDVTPPASLTRLFVTEIYRTEILKPDTEFLFKHLEFACRKMATEDAEGREWSQKTNYVGYTSFGTIANLRNYAPVFENLFALIDVHVQNFARLAEMDLTGKALVLHTSWINVLGQFGGHASHLHPQSAISGTVYVSVPQGASGIQFEDPRMPMMMYAPPRLAAARQDHQPTGQVIPERGTVLLWESWLRHEVPQTMAPEPRISISFNYGTVDRPTGT